MGHVHNFLLAICYFVNCTSYYITPTPCAAMRILHFFFISYYHHLLPWWYCFWYSYHTNTTCCYEDITFPVFWWFRMQHFHVLHKFQHIPFRHLYLHQYAWKGDSLRVHLVACKWPQIVSGKYDIFLQLQVGFP